MRKRMVIMMIALLVVFGGLFAFNLFRSIMMKRYFAHYEAPAVTISSTVAKTENWQPQLAAVGSFKAINGVDVNAEVGGNITQISFTSGQYVTKGTPLVTIDDSIDQATLKDNKANLVLQQLNFQRQVELYKRNATPGSSVDQARANLQQAQAAVEKTLAIIAQKHITTPFDGKLGIRSLNLGEYVVPGRTNIVTLQSLDPQFLEFYVPEQYLTKLYIGQTIHFCVESYPNKIFVGEITALNSKIDINTHNVLVQATAPNCDVKALLSKTVATQESIKATQDPISNKVIIQCDSKQNKLQNINNFAFTPGMFANINILLPKHNKAVVLPITAVAYSLYGDSVYLIKENGKDKDGKPMLTVTRIFVRTGEKRGNYVVILKGIKAGDVVVDSGQLKLNNGTRVIVNNSVKMPVPEDIDGFGQ